MTIKAKQLNQVPGGASTCQTVGPNAAALNLATVATGYASHAEGASSLVGAPLSVATLAVGGTLVTIAGDKRQYFRTGDPLSIIRTSPTLYPAFFGKTIAGAVTFAAGNTTFNLDSAVDAVTTNIKIAPSDFNLQGWGGEGHAEGQQCFVLGGTGAHAEGSFSESYGYGAHAEGAACIAQGNESHAEGETTQARGIDAHSEGGTTIAQGFCSHAEGGAGATPGPVASGSSSHAEGVASLTGFAPVAYTCAAGGTAISIAGNHAAEFVNGSNVGFVPTSPQRGLTIYQRLNSVPVFAAGFTTFSIVAPIDTWSTGGWTADGDSFGRGAHAEGSSTATGTTAHSEGTQTLASGNNSHAEGSQTQATATNCHAEGDRSQATNTSAHAEGVFSVANNVGAHSEGTTTLASGNSAHAEGKNSTASGDVSHAEGEGCTASGLRSHAEGQTCTASATGSHAEGGVTVASGNYSHAEGITCSALGVASHASGQDAKASNENEDCFGGTKFAAQGDAQMRRLVIKGITPGAAPGEAVILKSGGSTAVFCVASKSYMVKVRIIATKTGLGAAARQSGGYEYDFTVDCDSAGNLTISALTPLFAVVTGAAFVGAVVTAVTSGAGALNVTFTIAGGLTIASRIVGYIELVEVLGT